MKLSPRKEPFKITLGERGEMIAAAFLSRRNYQILEKNYRCPFGEIDLIVQKGGRIYFTEVKTRTSSRFGRPEEAVHSLKQQKLICLAEWYLKHKKYPDRPVSFMVLAVDWKGSGDPEVKVIENAFEVHGRE